MWSTRTLRTATCKSPPRTGFPGLCCCWRRLSSVSFGTVSTLRNSRQRAPSADPDWRHRCCFGSERNSFAGRFRLVHSGLCLHDNPAHRRAAEALPADYPVLTAANRNRYSLLPIARFNFDWESPSPACGPSPPCWHRHKYRWSGMPTCGPAWPTNTPRSKKPWPPHVNSNHSMKRRNSIARRCSKPDQCGA